MSSYFLAAASIVLLMVSAWLFVYVMKSQHLMRLATAKVIACNHVDDVWEEVSVGGPQQLRPVYETIYRLLDENGQNIDIRGERSTATRQIGSAVSIRYNREDPQGFHMIGVTNPIVWVLFIGAVGAGMGYLALQQLGRI